MIFRRLFLLLALCLVGCAGLGVPPADTFNKKALATLSTVETVAKSAQNLRAAGKLSDADRDNVVSTLETTVSGVKLARQLYTTNPQAGNDKLSATITVLTALQMYLATKGQ
jgi:hypothetical protein